jgi:hypothetical protein
MRSVVFTMYNFVCAKGSLKGQCHEIFDFRFFHESVSPKPLSYDHLIFFLICGNIRSSRCTTGVTDTGGKFTTSVIDTSGKLPLVSLTPVANLTPMANLTPAANLPPVSLTLVANLQRWACFFKFTNRKSANSWAQFAIANLQISKICEFTNFIFANLFGLICKRQSRKFRR